MHAVLRTVSKKLLGDKLRRTELIRIHSLAGLGFRV